MWGWCWRRAQRPLCTQFRTRRLPIDLLPTGLRGPVFVGPDALVWILVGLGTNSSLRTRSLRLAAPALLLPKMGPNERRTNVSRTAARLPTPLDVSILFSSRDFDNMSVHRRQSTKLHREAPARREDAQSQTEDRPPDLDHDTPHANQRAGFFFRPPSIPPPSRPPAYMLHRTREKASPAGTYSPGEPIRPPSAPPQARLPTYMRSSPTARNPTTQPSQERGFRSKLITVSLPRLPPLRNNTAVLKPPPGTRARSAKQAIAHGTPTKPTRASSPPQDLPKDPASLWGGEEEATHTAAGWTAAEKWQVKTPSGSVPRCFGCSGPHDSFQTRCSLFFLLACSPVAVVCVSLTCVVLEVTSYPPVVSVSQFCRARVRRSLARSAISRSHPPTHPHRPPALSALTRRQACSPAWGGVPLFPPAFRSTLVGTRR